MRLAILSEMCSAFGFIEEGICGLFRFARLRNISVEIPTEKNQENIPTHSLREESELRDVATLYIRATSHLLIWSRRAKAALSAFRNPTLVLRPVWWE